jgi:hypothetical protein
MFSTAIRSLYSGIQNKLEAYTSLLRSEASPLKSTVLRTSDLRSNPAYQHKQDIGDDFKYGSRNYFGTDCAINGEYFRSKSKNEYYNIIDKNAPAKDISELTFFIPSNKLPERLKMWKYDPKKHLIVRLAFDKNKKYFVESYQDINIMDRNPDVIVMTVDDKELLANLPEFVPLPDQREAFKNSQNTIF